MKTLGGFLTIIGAIATLITGIMVIQQTETIGIFGLDIVISQGNYVPLIISVIVLILGLVLLSARRGVAQE